MGETAKVWDRGAVLQLLDTNPTAVVRAIKTLYGRQTADEQQTGDTRHHNKRGFNGTDARFLSDLAVKLPRYNNLLTDRQLVCARKMLRKYWRQLLEEIEQKGGAVSYKETKTKAATPRPTPRVSPTSYDREPLYGAF